MNAFECPSKRLYQMKFNLTESTMTTTSCIYLRFAHIDIYTYTYTYVYLCIHCIIITELNLSSIGEWERGRKKKMMNTETKKMRIYYRFFLMYNLQISINNRDIEIKTSFFLYLFKLTNIFFDFYIISSRLYMSYYINIWQFEDDVCRVISLIVNHILRREKNIYSVYKLSR